MAIIWDRQETKPCMMLNMDIGQMQELQFIDEEKDLSVIIIRS